MLVRWAWNWRSKEGRTRCFQRAGRPLGTGGARVLPIDFWKELESLFFGEFGFFFLFRFLFFFGGVDREGDRRGLEAIGSIFVLTCAGESEGDISLVEKITSPKDNDKKDELALGIIEGGIHLAKQGIQLVFLLSSLFTHSFPLSAVRSRTTRFSSARAST